MYCPHGLPAAREECEDCEFARDLERSAGRPKPRTVKAPERVKVDTYFVDPVDQSQAVLVAAGDAIPAELLGRKRRKRI